MVSPIGPDILISYFENTELRQGINEMTDYYRYADDTLIVCNSRQYAIHPLEFFINAHFNIQFTME